MRETNLIFSFSIVPAMPFERVLDQACETPHVFRLDRRRVIAAHVQLETRHDLDARPGGLTRRRGLFRGR
jgi:hypothetical protein